MKERFKYLIYVCIVFVTFSIACYDKESETLNKSYIEELSSYMTVSTFGNEEKVKSNFPISFENIDTFNYYQIYDYHKINKHYSEGLLIKTEYVNLKEEVIRSLTFTYSDEVILEKNEFRRDDYSLNLFYKWKFKYDEKKNLIYEVGYMGNSAEDYSREYSYDENGYLIREVVYGNMGYDESFPSYHSSGHSVSKDEKFFEWKYDYDSIGNRITEIGFRPSGARDYTINYEFENTFKTEENGVYEYGNLGYKYTYVYDDYSNRVFRHIEKDMHYKKNYYYNDSFQIEKMETFDFQGNLLKSLEYEYDNKNIMVTKVFDSTKKRIPFKRIEYIYGESGYWIKQIVKYNERIYEIEKRLK